MEKDWKKLVTTLIENKYPFVKVVGYEPRYHRVKHNQNPADDTAEDYYAVKVTYDKLNEPDYDELNPWYWDFEKYINSLMKYVGKRLVIEFVD
jgi:hypothetical protein